MRLPGKVTVIEVGTRDGFQNEKGFIPTGRKVGIVDALSRAGLERIEVSAVVHPAAVPQLADAAEVMAAIDRRPGVSYGLLVPNRKGLLRALPLRPDWIHLMLSVSESHNRANANRPIGESLAEFEQIVPLALGQGVGVTGGLACGFGCPFEGKIGFPQIARVVDRYRAMGIRNVSISDTVGFANPRAVYETAARLLDRYPEIHWHAHIHNHRDLGLANILAAMQAGIATFDAAIGGLGGCPFAPSASGNVATEDLVNMLGEMGIASGVHLDGLLAAAALVAEAVPHPLRSALSKAGKPWALVKAPARQIRPAPSAETGDR